MKGVFDAPKTEDYNVSIQFNGPGTLLIDGKPVLKSDAREPKGVGERVRIEAGMHTIQIQYNAVMLNPTAARLFPVGQEARRLDLRTVRPS